MRKTDFDNTVSSLDSKIATNKTKSESIEKEFKKSKRNLGFVVLENILFDGEDGSQTYLIFQPVHRYVKIANIANTRYITEWKSKGLFDESIKPPPTSDKNLTPLIDYYSYNIRLKFNGSITAA